MSIPVLKFEYHIVKHKIPWISVITISLYSLQHKGFNGTLREWVLLSFFDITTHNIKGRKKHDKYDGEHSEKYRIMEGAKREQ